MTTACKNNNKIKTDRDVEKYIDEVCSGNILAGRLEKLAVLRYLNDLKNGEERGLYFDTEDAAQAIAFFPIVKHSKGKWAGQPFNLEGWQKFIVWNLFGWKNADGLRRFRIAYNEVARKNGKSTFAAALGLLMEVADGEQGAEIYTAATKMDQAKIIHDEAIKMVNKSPDLKKYLQVYLNNIVMPSTESKFAPLGADDKTMDGLNPHFATIDEFHAHKTSAIWDVLRSAMGARTQPMLFAITTAGFNTHCICKDQHDYAEKILEGLLEDDTFFAFICTLDKDDDWKNEKNWRKANPNLGKTVNLQDMREMCKKAIESPAEMNNFLCKKLNIWTSQQKKFFNMEALKKCNGTVDIETLKGKPCYQSMDMSTKIDIAGKCKLFELDDGRISLKFNFYCPKETAIKRSREDRVPYLKWAEQGWLTLTPGDVVDTEFVNAEIIKDWQNFDVLAFAFDPWNFEANRQALIKAGLDEKKILEFKQTLQNMSAPTKELESLVISGKLVFDNNPVFLWMCENTAVWTDPNENIRPVKNKSTERIDGVVAAVMALGLKLIKPAKKTSVYETRGLAEI